MNQPAFDIITTVIARRRHVTLEHLRMKSRPQPLAETRQFWYFLLRMLTSATLEDIGEFTERDHTTVLYGIGHIRNSMDVLPRLALEVQSTAAECIRELTKPEIDSLKTQAQSAKASA